MQQNCRSVIISYPVLKSNTDRKDDTMQTKTRPNQDG